MNSPVCGLRVASIIAGLVGVAHLLRLFIGFQVLVGSHPIPVWLSAVGLVVMGVLSFWLWKLSMPVHSAPPADSSHPAAPTKPAAA